MNILQVFNLQSFSKLRVKCKNNLQSWVGLFHSWDLGYRHSWELGYKGFDLLIKIYCLCFVFLLITAFGDLGSRACISANYNTFPTVNNTLGYILLIVCFVEGFWFFWFGNIILKPHWLQQNVKIDIECEIHIRLRGVFRTQSHIYNEVFFAKNAPSQMFEWFLNTPVRLMHQHSKKLTNFLNFPLSKFCSYLLKPLSYLS